MIQKNIRKNIQQNSKQNHRYKEAAWILLLFSTIFIFISLITYNHSDPSYFTASKKIPLNLGGKLGANFSEALVQLLGLNAYLFCMIWFGFLFESFKKKEKAELYSSLSWRVLGLACFSAWLDLSFSEISLGGSRTAIGGLAGHFFAELSKKHTGLFGSHLILIALCLIALVFSTRISVMGVFLATKKILLNKAPTLASFLARTSKAIGLFFWNRTHEFLAKRKTEQMLSRSFEQTVTATSTPKPSASVPVKTTSAPTIDDSNDIEFSAPFEKPAPKKASAHVSSIAHIGKTGEFSLPSLDFLADGPLIKSELDKNKLTQNSKTLEAKLNDFGIEGSVVAVRPGPVITMYEFKPGPGVKISQIATLADDLSLALSAQSVRIVAPIPGKNVVGIEIPNDERETVYLKEILSTDEFQASAQGIPLAIGKDISGLPVSADLSKMPHLLIAGAPGAGKSVFINSLICSLLYKFTPNDMRLIMVDPKQLELNLYEGIPHLLLPVVDDPKKASIALKWGVNEMERRYKIMSKCGIRNIAGFNQKLEKEGASKLSELLCPEDSSGMPGEGSLSHLFEHDEKGKPVIERMPVILVIIDEFADLMMVAPKDIETSVARLAQKARAAGIHLVIATQRPSVDVITGLIKANLPSRISFQVASKVDSRTILDSIGAEKLLGQGDMLFIPPGLAKLTRIHGAYVNEEEIGKICEHWKSQGSPEYREEILDDPEENAENMDDGDTDELYSQAVAMVRDMGQASASMIQRRFKVGYNRAARMVEAMERQGVVGPAEGSKPREVL